MYRDALSMKTMFELTGFPDAASGGTGTAMGRMEVAKEKLENELIDGLMYFFFSSI